MSSVQTKFTSPAKEELVRSISKFDPKFFVTLQKLKNPSPLLRNLILVFLTIFHEELDSLVDELSEDSKE